MRVGFYSKNVVDSSGNPAGGVVAGTGFTITWQDGPLGRGEHRVEPNGAFVEDVLSAVLERLTFYQEVRGGKFSCTENATAISYIEGALTALDSRTKSREDRGVEGTHKM